MAYRIAKALDTLRAQVNAAYPSRSKSSDGWIGDTAHASRKSDHNPNSAGVVQALDLTHDPAHGFDSYKFAEHLRVTKDNRIKYVISNHKIFMGSGSSAWKWQSYSGSNPHTMHVHTSVSDTPARYDDPRQWNIDATMQPGPTPTPPTDEPVLSLGDTGDDVTRMQTLLRANGGTLDADGIFGSGTQAQLIAFQASRGLDADGVCGAYTWGDLKIPTQPGMQYNITATVFGGTSDPNNSAYDGHPISNTELSYAVPYRAGGGRQAHFFNRATNKSANAQCWDVGPWMTTDSYPATSARPIAETAYRDKTPLPSGPNKGKIPSNPAGVDLAPGLAKALGIDGKGLVDFNYLDAIPPVAPDSPSDELVPVVEIKTTGKVTIIVNGKPIG